VLVIAVAMRFLLKVVRGRGWAVATLVLHRPVLARAATRVRSPMLWSGSSSCCCCNSTVAPRGVRNPSRRRHIHRRTHTHTRARASVACVGVRVCVLGGPLCRSRCVVRPLCVCVCVCVCGVCCRSEHMSQMTCDMVIQMQSTEKLKPNTSSTIEAFETQLGP